MGLACPSCCTLSLRSFEASASLAPTFADVVADVGSAWQTLPTRPFIPMKTPRAILNFRFNPEIPDRKTFGLGENGQCNFGNPI